MEHTNMAFFTISVLYIAGVLELANSYAPFNQHIPNGKVISNPCYPDRAWKGVGHQAKDGGGPRNPFGLDFEDNGYTWTVDLCEMDSDKDGRSNGVELGDPDCIWTKGSEPAQTEGLSHPGICEPLDSDTCLEVNSFLDCAATEFQCDIINDNDIKPIYLGLDYTAVPAEETTYMCQVFDLGISDRDYHLVAHTPNNYNIDVLHHVLVYGCKDEVEIDPKYYTPYECYMSRIEGCDDLVTVWTVGSLGVCYPENAGLRFGKSGYKRVVLEVHWNNPMNFNGYYDSSGVVLHLTPNLRDNDAGILTIGQMQLAIPPGEEKHTTSSTCSSECTQRSMMGNINIVGVLNHMHNLGISALSQMVSPDGTVHHLSNEEHYSFSHPKYVIFDEPIVMEPGYKLQMYCHYNSEDRSETTYYGNATNDEMCFSVIMYYPKASWIGTDCVSQGPYDSCGVRNGLPVDECGYAALMDPGDPVTAERNVRLDMYCEAGYCKDGCLDVVRDIFQEPCFKGENLKNIKEWMRSDEYDAATKLGIYDFFYRLDSCNAELAWEQCEWRGPAIGAVSSNMASFVVVATVAAFAAIM